MRSRIRKRRLIRRIVIVSVILLCVIGAYALKYLSAPEKPKEAQAESSAPVQLRPEVSSKPKPSPAPTPHVHNWQPVYEVIHTEAQGHYETIIIEDGWDEVQYGTGYICSVCGAGFSDPGSAASHLAEHDYEGSYYQSTVQIGTVHHDAVTEQQWVIDKGEETESVLTGYRCQECGEEKGLEENVENPIVKGHSVVLPQ